MIGGDESGYNFPLGSMMGSATMADAFRTAATDKDVEAIVYRVDSDAVIVLEVFEKKTKKTPKRVIDACQRRLKDYDSI